jgi:hypothetical protein
MQYRFYLSTAKSLVGGGRYQPNDSGKQTAGSRWSRQQTADSRQRIADITDSRQQTGPSRSLLQTSKSTPVLSQCSYCVVTVLLQSCYSLVTVLQYRLAALYRLVGVPRCPSYRWRPLRASNHHSLPYRVTDMVLQSNGYGVTE